MDTHALSLLITNDMIDFTAIVLAVAILVAKATRAKAKRFKPRVIQSKYKPVRRSLTAIPWFRFSRCPYGTVYLVQSLDEQGLFKVGLTTRRTKDRLTELNRVAGDRMKIIYTVSLYWAGHCEKRVLRKLRRQMFRQGDRRGTEWFWLKRGETIQDITRMIEHEAKAISRSGRLKFSWPKDASLKVFTSG